MSEQKYGPFHIVGIVDKDKHTEYKVALVDAMETRSIEEMKIFIEQAKRANWCARQLTRRDKKARKRAAQKVQ